MNISEIRFIVIDFERFQSRIHERFSFQGDTNAMNAINIFLLDRHVSQQKHHDDTYIHTPAQSSNDCNFKCLRSATVKFVAWSLLRHWTPKCVRFGHDLANECPSDLGTRPRVSEEPEPTKSKDSRFGRIPIDTARNMS